MKISEFLHLALPEEQWLPTISGVLRQFAEEECYVYERQPCWYLGKGCLARLHINADGTQATFIDDAGEQQWAVDTALNGEAYKQQVARAVAEIRRGEYVKVIVSRAIPLPSRIDMPATLLYGRQANTPVRSFMFRQEGREALGFSPELVMSVTGNKVVTEPLAGTRDRMGNPEHNKAKEAELLHDSKEVLEHILSVKEAIAELEAVCLPGSVVVEDLMSVRQRGSVQHLGSGVSGQLAENKDAWDAFTVLFPSITASGIPKNAALNAIMQIEKTPRELYSGAILLLDDMRFDAALVLRSVFQDSQRCWIQAGAGIIAQSTPERELTETREKLASIAPYLMV